MEKRTFSASTVQKFASMNASFRSLSDIVASFSSSSEEERASKLLLQEKRLLARVYNLLGRSLFEEHKWQESTTALERCAELDDSVPEAVEWLARAYDRVVRTPMPVLQALQI
jgi:uncharacterized protein HemY